MASVTRQAMEAAGRLHLDTLPRLRAAGEAEVQLRVSDDGSGRVIVRGRVKAQLTLTCQRCLGPVTRALTTEFKLVWVHSDAQAAALPPEPYEPLLSASGRVKVSELLEDELLLALPIVAVHATPEECSELGQRPASRPAETTANPFAVLGASKRDR